MRNNSRKELDARIMIVFIICLDFFFFVIDILWLMRYMSYANIYTDSYTNTIEKCEKIVSRSWETGSTRLENIAANAAR